MKKIFLAAPFKSLVDKKTFLMKEKSKTQIMSLICYLEDKGYIVHNAHKREQWGRNFMAPEQCTKIDYDEIENCDIFIAFPGCPPSPGTHIEIGWASAFKKKIYILLQGKKSDYAYLVRGLYTVADVTYLVYENENDCFEMLDKYL